MLEFLVREGNEQLLRDQAFIAAVWDLEISREDGYLRGVYTHQTRKGRVGG